MSKAIKMIDVFGTVVEPTSVELKMMEYCDCNIDCGSCKYRLVCDRFRLKYKTVPYRFEAFTEVC